MTNPFAAFEPPVHPPELPATDVSFALHDTLLGRLVLATAAGRLVLCAYAVDDPALESHLTRVAAGVSPRILRRPADVDAVRHQIDDYLSGRRTTFDLLTDLVLATTFQRAVLDGLTDTAYGQTTSYGALAASIGAPRAARAVGSALGANPLCIVLPCHRVLPAPASAPLPASAPALPSPPLVPATPPSLCENTPGNPGVFTHTAPGVGRIGGYAGGPTAKAALLALEQRSASLHP